jgi:hypothetical protein
MAKCEAKTRQGGRCEKSALVNGRCHLHGGRTPRGRAVSHGIYCRTFSEDEQGLMSQMRLGSVDDELKLMRIRLYRALRCLSEAEENDQAHLYPTETKRYQHQIEGNEGRVNTVLRQEKTQRRPDYDKIIDRTVGRIAQLERVRMELQAKLTHIDPDEFAEKTFEALVAMDASI